MSVLYLAVVTAWLLVLPPFEGPDELHHYDYARYVAATGRSYLCRDTAADPLYLRGAAGARSSLTVPLRFGDRIVGTFNVESTRPGAFGEADLHFAAVLGHSIATALHVLDLLSLEKTTVASDSIDAVRPAGGDQRATLSAPSRHRATGCAIQLDP